MRKPLFVVAMLIPLFVAGAASAHHMAEGIVADDIYAMIEENLVDSPHLDLVLTTSPTMNIVTVTVAEADVPTVLGIIGDVLMGEGRQVESSLLVEISDTSADGLVTIAIVERMGKGNSQVL